MRDKTLSQRPDLPAASTDSRIDGAIRIWSGLQIVLAAVVLAFLIVPEIDRVRSIAGTVIGFLGYVILSGVAFVGAARPTVRQRRPFYLVHLGVLPMVAAASIWLVVRDAPTRDRLAICGMGTLLAAIANPAWITLSVRLVARF